jgi:CHAD domain-containing protein
MVTSAPTSVGPTVRVPDAATDVLAAAETAVAIPIDRHSSATSAVRRALAEPLLRLLRNEEGARAGDDPEAIHQARVATRRLRADLATLRPLLEKPYLAREVREALAWLGVALGSVRELDVLSARLTERAARLPVQDGPSVARLLLELRKTRGSAHGTLTRAFDSPRYGSLVSASEALLEGNARQGMRAVKAFRPLMKKEWRRTCLAFRDLGADSADKDLHVARISAKRARYAAQAFEPVFGAGAARFAKQAAKLQDILGEHQDSVVAEAWLRERATTSSPVVAFVAGELAAEEARARAEARAAWPAAWRSLSRRKLRFWI